MKREFNAGLQRMLKSRCGSRTVPAGAKARLILLPFGTDKSVPLTRKQFELSLRRGGCCFCGGGESRFRSMI
jgi:hypothetical protein